MVEASIEAQERSTATLLATVDRMAERSRLAEAELEALGLEIGELEAGRS